MADLCELDARSDGVRLDISAALRDSLPTGGGLRTSGFLQPDDDIDRIESTL